MGAKLGQHFLVNKGIIEKIIAAAPLEKSGAVLEIGPGKGALTFALAARAKKVIAVEKDEALAHMLREKLTQQNIENVEVITGDILDFLSKNYELKAKSYQVVANIPYYLTSALIRALLESPRKPDAIILMIQKEVAQRICAKDGTESILSLSVKLYADPRILFFVSRGSFSPPPKVDSAVIEITPKKEMLPADPADFFRAVKAGFSAPRKKLTSNLATKLAIPKDKLELIFLNMGIPANARAETLSFNQWIKLTKCF